MLSAAYAAVDQSSDSDASELWQQRVQLEKELQNQITEFQSWCADNKHDELSANAGSLVIRRDPQRQYIFLPPEHGLQIDSSNTEGAERLVKIRREHAAKLFALAKEQAEKQNASFAFQLLNEVLFYDPDHAEVRSILGHRKLDSGDEDWQVSSDRFRIKPATRTHPEFGWAKKDYLIASTAHFDIVSKATEEETKFLAQQLERWHDVWRQVFFDYWSNPSALGRWINGKGSARIPSKKFKIVFLADKPSYVQQLARNVPGVEISTGYYDDRQETSFFYAGQDASIHKTWRHELTHQLFSETTRSTKSPFESQFLWLGEGVAMYFESLVDFDSYVTLGGFDSSRLQYARLRCLKEQFYVPLRTLSSADRKAFQANPNVAQIYSQSAGITHFLMNAEHGAMQQPLSEFMKLCYQAKLKPDTFEKLMGRPFEKIDEQYREFLKVDSKQVRENIIAPDQRSEFALPGTPLDAAAMEQLGRCKNMQWLDLSGTDLRGTKLQALAACGKLEQLFMTGALVDQASITAIGQIANLREIDLSGSNITDSEMSVLCKLVGLTDLMLAGTAITDQAIPHLVCLEQLHSLNISNTRITPEGISRLKSQLPNTTLIVGP